MTRRSLARVGCFAVLFAMMGAVAAPAAKADPIVYVTGLGNEFGTLDLTTGSFSQIAKLNLPAGDFIYGMGYGADGNLYGVDSDPDANLWQINRYTGAVTLVGAIGQSALDATSSAKGTLYVLSQDLNAVYYTMNPPSTTPTVVGPIGMSSGGLMAVSPDGSRLFTTTQSTYDLVSINPTSGATNDIGPTGFMIDNGLFVDGTLYGFDTVGAIVTINTTTGAGNQVATYSLPNGDAILASALVPEPSSLVLGLIGVVLAGSFGRFRARRRTSADAGRRGG